MAHTVFGIRHHGPGSARSLERALDALQPDTVLIEGPPEADALLELAAREDMEPPVALLTYVPDEPARAAFYPFARFSPEWRAIRHALAHDVPVRFMDLPAANKMAARDEEPTRGLRADPLAALAEVAGHGDPERWWEDVVESRRDENAFEAVTEAMGALREAFPEHDASEERREAFMRQSIRAANKAAENVAVICGAWHAPALTDLGPAAPDQRTLKGLPKVKVATTWVPWTYGLLARASGYGAGVDSPAWYDQLFDEADDPVARWLSRAAQLLRAEGLDASAAQVVDAARLAMSLAGIRDRPLAGLDELLDATRAVLCHGSDVPLALVRAELVVGHRLGEVPEDTPMVPLQQDVARLQRRLRLKPEAQVKEVTLDLRRENDRERSRLLHRLNLLDVPWGSPTATPRSGDVQGGASGCEWFPELALELIHAGRWGTTVHAAAAARVKSRASEEESVGALATLADAVLLADLPDALEAVLRALADRAALDRDTADLMTAVPPLAGILRYGDVRGSDTSSVAQVLRGIVLRVAIGLPGAGVGADEQTGAQLATAVDNVNAALALLQDEELTRAWREALRRVTDGDRLPGTLAGRATRLLHDAGELEPAKHMSRALSPGEDPERGASWIEGFIGTSGLILVHDPELLATLDGWVATVPQDAFTNVLPLLRRAFSAVPPTERRRLGETLTRT